jgi:hypothetical protein
MRRLEVRLALTVPAHARKARDKRAQHEQKAKCAAEIDIHGAARRNGSRLTENGNRLDGLLHAEDRGDARKLTWHDRGLANSEGREPRQPLTSAFGT